MACLIAAIVIGGGSLASGWVTTISQTIGISGFGFIGAVLISRDTRNVIGWVLLSFAFFFALNGVGEELAVYSATELGSPLVVSQNIMFLAGSSFALAEFSLAMFFFLFPTGKIISSGWRWAAWFIAAALPLSVMGIFAISRAVTDVAGFLAALWDMSAAGGPIDTSTALFFTIFGSGAQSIGLLIGAAAMIVRLRRASGIERLQVKWVIYACAFAALSSAIGISRVLPESISVIGFASSLILPLAGVSIALFRYRLYDIDRLVSRTVSYALLVALLAGFFAALVAVITSALPAQGDLAVAASTLVVAAVFNPLRKRILSGVDRRFNRSGYNAQLVVEEFTASLQNRLDIDDLAAGWLDVANTTMQPAVAAVWIKER